MLLFTCLLLSISLVSNSVNAVLLDSCSVAGKLALTFDEGPSENTETILDFLASKNVKATFHIIVRYLTSEKRLALVRRMIGQGHEVGIRLDPILGITLTPTSVCNYVSQSAKVIENRFGFIPKFVRLPYGTVQPAIVSALETNGFVVTQSNLDSGDYENGASVEDIVEKFRLTLESSINSIQSFISLQNEQAPNTAKAVPYIIEVARENGYKLVRLSDCLGVTSTQLSDLNSNQNDKKDDKNVDALRKNVDDSNDEDSRNDSLEKSAAESRSVAKYFVCALLVTISISFLL